MTDISNPFSNPNAVSATVPLAIQKIGSNTAIQTTFLPSVPASYTSGPLSVSQAQGIVNALSFVQGQVSNNQIVIFNTTELAAINTTLSLYQTLLSNGAVPAINVTYSSSELSNIAIAMTAIQSIQYTGLLITPTDLSNSNTTIQTVTGFAPNGAYTIECHDQHFICDMPGTGQWAVSNVGNGFSWNPLSVGVMETYSDQPIAINQYLGYVVVFGLQSIEFWVDQGNIPMPYVILPGSAQQYGCSAYKSICRFMGTVAFLGSNRTGQVHVLALNGTGVPTIISTPDLDEIINGFTVVNDAVAYAYDNNGHSFYRITFPTAGRSFDYDGTSQAWNEIQSGVKETGRHLTTLAATFNNGTIASDYASGNVYILDPANYTDNGYIIKREFASKHLKADGNMFSVNLLELVMQVGSGSQANNGAYTTDPHIQLEVSNDGGYTWGKPKLAQIGAVGQYLRRVYWSQLGSGFDFVFRWKTTDAVPFVIISGYATIDLCEEE